MTNATQDDAVDDGPHTLKIERVIAAPRAAVWQCWTQEALLQRWFAPAPWKVTEIALDPQPGGRFNLTMRGPEGDPIETTGMWLQVEPMDALTFTDAYREGFIPQAESFMTSFVRLADTPGGTAMVWGARHTSAKDKERHLAMGFEGGWGQACTQLEAVAKGIAEDDHGDAPDKAS